MIDDKRVMCYGYDAVINGEKYFGRFSEDSFSEKESAGEYVKTIYEKNENGIVFRMISEADLVAQVERKRLEIENKSGAEISITKANIAAYVPITIGNIEYYTSEWGYEYTPVFVDATYNMKIGTNSGRSCKGCSPYFSFGWEGFCFLGVSVGWSGNWAASFERLPNNECLVSSGLYDEGFSYTLKNSEIFDNIDIYFSFIRDTREALSFRFRKYYRRNISMFKDMEFDTLPVGYNHWWPYGDILINEDVFYENAVLAKEMGCTNALLDAGWFGPSEIVEDNGEMSWFNKRGDWDKINTALFPSGIAALSEKTSKHDINFGIWCEIEALGKDAELNKTSPNLIAIRDGKHLGYVCFGNPETVDWALGVVKVLAEEYNAKWIKFDFNLDPGFGCNRTDHGHSEGDGLYQHYKGYYRFLDEIHKRYPDIIIENCSSGGLRIDYEIMKHTHFSHLSDPDYTKHHLQCFWGATSHIHPSSCMHFSWSETLGGGHNIEPNPITAEVSQEKLNYIIRSVLTGVPGFSYKLPEMPKWCFESFKKHIEFYKRISKKFIFDGDMYRLTKQSIVREYSAEQWNAYQYNNKNDSLIFVFKTTNKESTKTIYPVDLAKELMYNLYFHNTGESIQKTGFELMTNGLTFENDFNEWSEIIEITAVNE